VRVAIGVLTGVGLLVVCERRGGATRSRPMRSTRPRSRSSSPPSSPPMPCGS
jgi:hypothetical protein